MRHPAVLRRIIAYLQETLIYEFPWLVRDSKTFEILESKRHRASVSTKHVAADLLTLIAVCGFLFVLILVSIRCPKDEDEEEQEEEEEEQEEEEVGDDDERNREDQSQDNANEASETITDTSVEGSMYSLAPLEPADPKPNTLPIRHDCGDHYSHIQHHTYRPVNDDDDEQLATINFAARDFLRFPDILDVEDSAVRDTTTYMPSSRICGRRGKVQQQQQGCAERDWFVRQTRSGHVYGRYPL